MTLVEQRAVLRARIDGARTLAEAWAIFSTLAVPVDATAEQRESLRGVFYAGATVMCDLAVFRHPADEAEGVAHVAGLVDELRAYALARAPQ